MKTGHAGDSRPFFPFYAADWLSAERVASMTLSAQGAYVRALCMQWRDGSLPVAREKWERLFPGLAQSDLDDLLDAFPVGDDIRRRNGRLERERKLLDNRAEAHRLGAQMTNAKRSLSATQAPRSEVAPPTHSESESYSESEVRDQKSETSPIASLGAVKKPRKPATGPHADLLRFWESEWARTRGVDWAWTKPDLVAMSKCLKLAGDEGQREVETRITRILENTDRWTADNASPRILASHWNTHGFKIIHKPKTALQETLDSIESLMGNGKELT